MAYDTSKIIDLGALKIATSRIKAEYLQAISKSGHARFEKADQIPDPDTAEENVLYLVYNRQTGHYDIYALINGAMELLDDMSVDPDALEPIVFKAEKTELEKADSDVIIEYFLTHSEVAPKTGDVFIVNTIVNETNYETSSYIYNGENWEAITGNVDADKVIFRDNIMMAGNYTQVGNKTKTQNGTSEFETKGMSVTEVFTEIFSKRLQPTIIAQPSVDSFTLTGAGTVEAGTKIVSAAYSGASLNAGSYIYGPETGVTASSWNVERITNIGTVQVKTQESVSLTAGTDDNDGNGFIVGDSGGNNVVSSLKYKVTATHGAGVVANDNLGSPSSPEIKIEAGTKTKETAAYTSYRNYFYGSTATKPELDSTYIRSLTKSGKAYTAGTITVNVKAGDVRVIIACIGDKKGVTKVINESAMNADVTDTFVKSSVQVEGADGYIAKEYNVWVYEPAKPYENAAVLKVTLG